MNSLKTGHSVEDLMYQRASLFPDLDGYAASLKLRYNSLKTPEEVIKQQLKMLEDEDFKLLP